MGKTLTIEKDCVHLLSRAHGAALQDLIDKGGIITQGTLSTVEVVGPGKYMREVSGSSSIYQRGKLDFESSLASAYAAFMSNGGESRGHLSARIVIVGTDQKGRKIIGSAAASEVQAVA
jgi:hypothetical protein